VKTHLRIGLLIGLSFGASDTAALCQPPQEKTWHFNTQHGVIEIRYSAFRADNGSIFSSLGISSGPGTSSTVAEEARFLVTVLDELHKNGSDSTLSFIQLRLLEPDAIRKVAVDAARSSAWRLALHSRGGPGVYYPLVTKFLNSSGAYRELDDAFRAKGFRLKAAGVEKVGMEPFSHTGARCPERANCAFLQVPNDALVQINILPLDRH
jgi:hypothetical protein